MQKKSNYVLKILILMYIGRKILEISKKEVRQKNNMIIMKKNILTMQHM